MCPCRPVPTKRHLGSDRIELLLRRAKVVLGLREERLGLLLVLALVLHGRLLLRRENLALLKWMKAKKKN